MEYKDYEVINANFQELVNDMKSKYEELTKRKLTDASPEMLIFKTVSYALGLREEKYNDEIKQNYLRFARGERLDLKGELYGERGKRLKESPARATFKFMISKEQKRDIIIPKNSRIRYNDLYFYTDNEYKVKQGGLFTTGIATCSTLGTRANNIAIGEINEMVDIYPYYSGVENITITNNGTDEESDEGYRNRVREIPKSFTTAGSSGAYSFWAKSASSNILDVTVNSPSATNVDVYILTDNGLVSEELKIQVENTLNDENIRPLTDKLTIKSPIIYNYNIDFDYYIERENETLLNIIKENVKKAVDEFITWQKEKIGRDINPDELIKKLKLADVKRVVLREPTFKKLDFNQVAINTSSSFNYQGVEDL
ncbi:baseplate J/gp47 family protein [Streptobacillus moniliformis]|uniref:baseplate assembly protein n=1 Tax=Streptobacillus moniliformis TaxID=34105 RepID=UPI0007E4D691|nr:baseplate J/gp47 family protein [Streptobacillus moniliformis]